MRDNYELGDAPGRGGGGGGFHMKVTGMLIRKMLTPKGDKEHPHHLIGCTPPTEGHRQDSAWVGVNARSAGV